MARFSFRLIALLLMISLLLTSCSGTSPGSTDDPGGLSSGDFLMGTGPSDGIYRVSTLIYQVPEITPCLMKYDDLGVLGEKLYGFDFRGGRWDLLGKVEPSSLSVQDIAERIDESWIDKDLVFDPLSLLLQTDLCVQAENGITYYLHPHATSFVDGVIAEEKNGKIRAVWLMGRMDEFPQEIPRCLQDEEAPVPTRLTLFREKRTFTVSIPAINFTEKGTFQYSDDLTLHFRTENGADLMILKEIETPTPYGIWFEYQEGNVPGDYLKKGMVFQVPNVRVALMDMWGTEQVDLDRDGKQETVYFGDYGLSGPQTLTVSVDSAGLDAYVWYLANFRSISFRTQGKSLFVDTVYQRFREPEASSSFEVRYDGQSVWLEDEQGIPVDPEYGINR